MSLLRWLIVVPVAGLIGACSSAGPKLHPVRGTVLFEGQPAEGATVILDPVGASDGAAKPSGVVRADGTFAIQTHPHGDGAPAGEYAVLVTWYPPNARGMDNPRNKLPAKYGDPNRTPVARITVQAGRNDLEPFHLSAK